MCFIGRHEKKHKGCLDGALISSEVNTPYSSGSDPCKNIDRDTAVGLVNMEKTIR